MTRLGGMKAWMAAAILCAAPALTYAQQQQYGQPPNTYVTWGSNAPTSSVIDVTYFVGSASLTGNMPSQLITAANAWSAAGASVRLVELTGPGAQAAANIVFQVGVTGNAAIVTAVIPSAAGPGTYPNGSPWRQINGQVTVTANSLFTYWDGTGVQPGTSLDFQAVALQMAGLGLGLGLAAFGDTTSVMQQSGTFPVGSPGNQALSQSDLTSIAAVYGTPEPATFALLGVGLAALGFSKKFRLS